MTGPFVVAGVALQAIAWRLAALARLSFWPAVAVTWAIVGLSALLAGDPGCCADLGVPTASVVGAVSGLLLYGTTRVVVTFATTRAALARAVDAAYGRSSEASVLVVWLLTLGIVVPGEELFWRGVVTPWFVGAMAPIAGAVLAWILSVGVAAAWWSLPFVAAAVVGGALWTTLAVWSGGVLAPLASHLVWTACMIAWPPPRRRAKVPG